jgi:WXG100 family type VII secretion target
MGTYSVSIAQVDATVAQAETISQQISQILTSLESDIQRTLAQWTGSAQAAYATSQAQWHAAAQNMPVALTQAKATLENIAQGYGLAEQFATQSMGGH